MRIDNVWWKVINVLGSGVVIINEESSLMMIFTKDGINYNRNDAYILIRREHPQTAMIIE